MKHRHNLVALALTLGSAPALAGDWPGWRGPLGTGAAPDAEPPLTWSESENIAWKAPLPGHGKSTPIVLGDRVFLLAAIEAGPASEEQLAARELFPDQMTQAPDHLVAFHPGLGSGEVATFPGQVLEIFSGLFEPLVFLEASNQFSARIIFDRAGSSNIAEKNSSR